MIRCSGCGTEKQPLTEHEGNYRDSRHSMRYLLCENCISVRFCLAVNAPDLCHEPLADQVRLATRLRVFGSSNLLVIADEMNVPAEHICLLFFGE